MATNKEKHIIDSWMQNAKPWISAISNAEIESRKLITNQAIIDTVLKQRPLTVLDIGCGEGWLARALGTAGVSVQGIDVVPELVEQAGQLGSGTFQVLSYEELAMEAFTEQFDVAVCNFSLLGDESVNYVFQSISKVVHAEGYFIVQTMHPVAASAAQEYEDGWRSGSWAGFKQFTNPPPWYFRTMETWKALFADYGMDLLEIKEPLFPGTDTFASVIFVGQVKRIRS